MVEIVAGTLIFCLGFLCGAVIWQVIYGQEGFTSDEKAVMHLYNRMKDNDFNIPTEKKGD